MHAPSSPIPIRRSTAETINAASAIFTSNPIKRTIIATIPSSDIICFELNFSRSFIDNTLIGFLSLYPLNITNNTSAKTAVVSV